MKNMKIRDTKKRTENKRIREGDYAKPGVTIQGEWTTFTFDAEKEDSCFVVLKDIQTEKEKRKDSCSGRILHGIGALYRSGRSASRTSDLRF